MSEKGLLAIEVEVVSEGLRAVDFLLWPEVLFLRLLLFWVEERLPAFSLSFLRSAAMSPANC